MEVLCYSVLNAVMHTTSCMQKMHVSVHLLGFCRYMKFLTYLRTKIVRFSYNNTLSLLLLYFVIVLYISISWKGRGGGSVSSAPSSPLPPFPPSTCLKMRYSTVCNLQWGVWRCAPSRKNFKRLDF